MKRIIVIILACFYASMIFAQETQETKKAVNLNRSLLGYFIMNESKPVSTYDGGLIIDNQTSMMSSSGTLEMMIQHRFGTMENGIGDFFGIYGTANTRIGLNYSITDWAQIGFGSTKDYKLQDVSFKMNLLRQSRDKKSPVDVTYYMNLSLDARDSSYFGESYQFGNRYAHFHELMVSRRFCDWFSMSVGGSFTHFNQVDSLYDHDKIALHFVGRVKFSSQSSIIINCDVPLKIDGISEWYKYTNPPKYNFGIGYEVATATHVFQVFASSGRYLVPQYNVMKNEYAFFKNIDNVFIGFNISRVWNF